MTPYMSSRNSNLRKKYNIPVSSNSAGASAEETPSPADEAPASEESPREVTHEYNQLETAELIETLNKELEEERENNKTLEEGKYSEKKQLLIDFSKTYSETIYQHMKVLEETVNDLKQMVEKNEALSTAKEDYEEYISRSDTTRLLETVRTLADLKQDGEAFLMSRRTKK